MRKFICGTKIENVFGIAIRMCIFVFMNENGTITLRARDDKKWVLQEVEKLAKKQERSISYYVLAILEQHLKKIKK